MSPRLMALDLIATSIGFSGRPRSKTASGSDPFREPCARRLIEARVDRQHLGGQIDASLQALVRDAFDPAVADGEGCGDTRLRAGAGDRRIGVDDAAVAGRTIERALKRIEKDMRGF